MLYNTKMLIGLCIIAIVTIPVTLSTAQDFHFEPILPPQETTLHVSFFDSLQQLFLPGAGYMVQNTGDETAQNVIGTILLEGGFDDSLRIEKTYEFGEIHPMHTAGSGWLREVDGFGPVTVTASVDASNAEIVSITAKGFQLGLRTFIFE